LRCAGLEIVLKVQVITYPRTSCVRPSSPALGPYWTIKPDRIAFARCNRVAAKLMRFFVVNDGVSIEVEVVSLI
jgi:hypothetical protein